MSIQVNSFNRRFDKVDPAQNSRIEIEHALISSFPEQTSNSRGVISRKLSRLTRVIRTLPRPAKSFSRRRTV